MSRGPTAYDVTTVERAAAGRRLRLPRGPHRGRVGEVRASSAGSALELHDFRGYHPGDDLRHVDWNAAARLGELVIRVRQDEVSPRVEVVLDATRSMGVEPEKAARALEIAAWVLLLAQRGGLETTVLTVGRASGRALGVAGFTLLERTQMDGEEAFDVGLGRSTVLRPCGLRVVVSDFLLEASPVALTERLARGAAGLALVQVLGAEDLQPLAGGQRLIDSETGEAIERLVTPEALESYATRLSAHVALWESAARRARASWAAIAAPTPLEGLARGALGFLVDPQGAR